MLCSISPNRTRQQRNRMTIGVISWSGPAKKHGTLRDMRSIPIRHRLFTTLLRSERPRHRRIPFGPSTRLGSASPEDVGRIHVREDPPDPPPLGGGPGSAENLARWRPTVNSFFPHDLTTLEDREARLLQASERERL